MTQTFPPTTPSEVDPAPPPGASGGAPSVALPAEDLGEEAIGPVPAPSPDEPRAGFTRRLWRGRPEDPAWVRPTLFALLAATAVLYLWGLGASGWANSFYSAAVQAGTKSWKAFFFGSSDAANFITVDKPPASLWVMEISARIFGVNAWSILVPQALEGVATVAVLYAAVRRAFRPAAGLVAGAVLAVTPVAALMFRFNNPDALLVLLLTIAAYATLRAVEEGRTRWLVLAGSLIGLGFITKMLQALILLPVLGAVYLFVGPPRLGRRIVQLVWCGLATVVAGGWWVAAVQLTPAADRPYIGGSTDNNLLNLIFGYNGFGRLTGNETGSVVPGGRGGAGGAGVWGPTGWNRLFLSEMGGQISWLIPAALIGLVASLWVTRRAPRTDRGRAAFLVFGGWLLLTGAVFSLSKGIIHPYYTVALAPAVGALVGMAAATLWAERSRVFPRLALAAAVVASVVWAVAILDWSPHWLPWLRWTVLVAGLAAAVALVALPRARGVLAAGIAGLGLAAVLAAPTAYAVQTAATPHAGSIPSAGPTLDVGSGGGPGGFPGGRAGGFPGGGAGGFPGGGAGGVPAGRFGAGSFPGRGTTGGTIRPGAAAGGGFPPAGFPGRTGPGSARTGLPRGPGGAGGALGGLLDGGTPDKAVVALLQHDASRYTWVAATTGSNSASGFQLASGDPVMAIGGFNGSDPTPTLAQFQTYVREGKIHFYIAGGGGFGGRGGGGPAGSSTSDASAISSWVSSHFTAKTVGGVTVYDLTTPTSTATTSSAASAS